MEYRTKFLNPKWADAMVNEGSGGVYEISQRMTAIIGWGGTADFTDNWVYDQAADTYALDTEMAEKLRKANPEAFQNILGKMLEAHRRGFWQASEDKLQKLQDLYDLTNDDLEGILA
jgi:magnesium chelatase subunit H